MIGYIHGYICLTYLFLLHETKKQFNHEMLFKIFSNKTRSNKGVAIVTDAEASFAKAVDIRINMEYFGCWRHMINDIKQWLSDQGGSRDDRTVYVDDVLID